MVSRYNNKNTIMKPTKTPIIYSYVGGIVIGSGIDVLTHGYVGGSLIGIGIAFLWVSLAISKNN
jgi:hypothetical protein